MHAKKIHWLSNRNEADKTADCAFCGLSVPMRKRGGVWGCSIAQRKWSGSALARKKREQHGEIKLTGCAVCGYDRCKRVLHFHHVHPEEKSFTISAKRAAANLPYFIEEMKKCVLVCANCHGEIHEGLISQAMIESFPRAA